VPVIWKKQAGGTRYEVRAYGAALRLYSDGVFHSAWNPRHGLTGRVWDLFLVAAFACARAPRRILMLGIGGGTSLLQFHRFLEPVRMVGVDLDAVHIEVARECFGVDESVADLVHADARDWVAGYAGPRFDLVVDDLFGHVGGEPLRAVPMDARWARALGRLVAPGGVLAANFIAPKGLRASALGSSEALRARYAGAYQLRTASDANAVGVFCRSPLTPREWRARVRAVPGLDDRARACPLDYEIRRLGA
jgi:hypothetical protein